MAKTGIYVAFAALIIAIAGAAWLYVGMPLTPVTTVPIANAPAATAPAPGVTTTSETASSENEAPPALAP